MDKRFRLYQRVQVTPEGITILKLNGTAKTGTVAGFDGDKPRVLLDGQNMARVFNPDYLHRVTTTDSHAETIQWPIENLKANPLNPRGEILENDASIEELAASIKEVGLLQPPTITPAGVIVFGHRRVRACIKAGLETIPVFVRDHTEQEQLVLMITENLQREDLNLLQEARAIESLIKTGISEREAAKRLGTSLTSVGHKLKVLKLPIDLQRLCAEGKLGIGHVINLMLVEPEKRIGIGLQAAEQNWPAYRIIKESQSNAVVNQKPKPPVSRSPDDRARKKAAYKKILVQLNEVQREAGQFHALRNVVKLIDLAIELFRVKPDPKLVTALEECRKLTVSHPDAQSLLADATRIVDEKIQELEEVFES